MNKFSSPAAYIAEALYCAGCFFGFNAHGFNCFACCNHYAAAGSCGTAQRAADADWFTGNEARFILPFQLAVFIHHPAHNLSVGIHIRGRNIHFFADNGSDSVNVAAGQTFKFCLRKFGRVNNNAAFAAAVRQIGNCAFAGHPESQSFYFVHINALMITDAAFGRAHNCAVLAAVTGKYFGSAVIHFYRNGNFQSSFRAGNNCRRIRVKFHNLNSFVQRNLRHFK